MIRPFRTRLLVLTLAALELAGCSGRGDVVLDKDIGIVALRSTCPSVGIPTYTGDMTLFSAPGRTDAGAIDVVATITNLRSQCTEGTDRVVTSASFDVLARRTDSRGARRIELP